MANVEGSNKVNKNLKLRGKQLEWAVANAVEKTLVDIANNAKKDHEQAKQVFISQSTTFGQFGTIEENETIMGKFEPHGLNRFVSRTGTLVRSIMSKVIYSDASGTQGIVYTNIEYGIFVELGTEKSKAYPYLFPALLNNKDNFIEHIRYEFNRVMYG